MSRLREERPPRVLRSVLTDIGVGALLGGSEFSFSSVDFAEYRKP